MEQKEMIEIALTAIRKNMDYETLYYSDYMYGKEKLTDEVWEYVVECKEIGSIAFKDKYAAQQSMHPTSGTLRGLEVLSTPEENPAPEVLSTPPTCG